MIFLICGGRNFGVLNMYWGMSEEAMQAEEQRVKRERDLFVEVMAEQKVMCEHHIEPVTCVIHGAAPGADFLAGWWAMTNNIPVRAFPADWRKYGKRAGFRRNQQMLDEGKPDIVFAFPGGNGTKDMVKRAKAAGVPVLEIS